MQTSPAYHVIGAIHEGVSTRIYRAIRIADQRPVILKTCKSDHPPLNDIVRLRREFEIMSSLDLPGVVTIYDMEQTNYGLALVMEDFDGVSLDQLLASPLDLDDFLHIALNLAETLAAIHQRTIIHKDVKPANVIVNTQSGEVKLIDFGIASRLPRETSGLTTPAMLEGTLAYLAPEQTGRMNRSVDYRADFYALGITFYQMLTGRRPFEASDALEMVHAHIAREATPPHVINQNVPEALSAITMKLMAKNAEDRYQSAHGLAYDLRQCQQQLARDGQIGALTPGLRDYAERLQLPQRLYGRERELAVLNAAFEDAARGEVELLLVAGYAGVGKSSLIQELYKPVTERRGYFIAGKFDQLKRTTPYAAFIDAFGDLVRQLLAEGEVRIARWRAQFLDVLGPNGQLIVDLLPDLELIIGRQPALSQLPPGEAQNRFNLVFQNFLNLLAQPEHPLVIVLDDLQWADSASLQLLELLMSRHGDQALLLVGSYRDNEVGESHPLTDTLAAIRDANATVRRIDLQPLGRDDLRRLTADALARTADETADLADLLLQKTDGNPFFVGEFLKALYADDLLYFDSDHLRWEWDTAKITQRGMTDNVIDLMTGRINQLPVATRTLLRLAAAVGNRFDMHSIAALYEHPLAATAAALWPALQEGLILPLDGEYRLAEVGALTATDNVTFQFLHDRVQQAAYSLVPQAERAAIHLAIGRMLWRTTADEHLFDTVNQLTMGVERISDQQERVALARLTARAGQKAQAALAYQQALRYFSSAMELMPSGSWAHDYDLMTTVVMGRAQCAYLSRDFALAERLFAELLDKSRTPLEQAQVYAMRVVLESNNGRFAEAIPLGREGLRLLGFDLPVSPTEADVGAAIGLEQQLRAGRPISALLHLPEMRDPQQIAVMTLLLTLLPCAFVTRQSDLWALMVLTMIHLSYQHGNTPASAVAYGSYGILLGAALGDHVSADAFGKLASDLTEPLHNPAFDSKIYFIRGTFLNHWSAPLRTGIPLLARSRQASLDSGDFFYAGYDQEMICNLKILQGEPLVDVEEEVQRALALTTQINATDVHINMLVVRQWLRCLYGQTASLDSFSDDAFDEQARLVELQHQSSYIPLLWYANYKLQVLYLAGEYEQMEALLALSEPFTPVMTGTAGVPERSFYQALALAQRISRSTDEECQQSLEQLQAIQTRMQQWATSCPENFFHKYALIQAEIARISGEGLASLDWYDQAIQSAQDNGFTQQVALANEAAARMLLDLDKTRLAKVYLADARYAYLTWGAMGKVQQLDERYPHLLPRHVPAVAPDQAVTLPFSNTTQTSHSNTGTVSLDLTTILKSAESIAGEIVLERLLKQLLRIALENAGAQRAVLIINEDGRLLIEAAGVIDRSDVAVLQAIPVDSSDDLSAAIVHYVARTQSSLVLDDATHQGPFTRDAYVLAHHPRSILCAPLINGGRLTAILYLENNVISGAFTANRLAMLNVLAGQAAIAIENARLYTSLEVNERKYRALFEESRDAIFISTIDGYIETMNPAGLRLFGYSASEMTGLSVPTLYADLEQRRQIQEQLAREGMVRDFEVMGRRKNGSEVACVMTATQRRNHEGVLLGYQGIIRDITAQKRAEYERLRLTAIERELTLAHNIQQSLLPAPCPNWQAVDLVCSSTAAREVGGDLYAYHAFTTTEGQEQSQRFVVAVGDVSGKGMPAALLMAVSLASFRSAADRGMRPAALLAQLNGVLADYTRTTHQNCALVTVEITLGSAITLRTANAGCIPPLVKRANGETSWIEVGGFPLGAGLGAQTRYTEATSELAHGDLVILVSDGLVEAHNRRGELFGFERLEQTVAHAPTTSANALLEHIRAEVASFVGSTEQHDDITLVALQV